MEERREGDERERKGKDRRGEMEEKRNAGGKRRKDAGGKEKGRVKGLSVCERGRGSRLGACLYAFLRCRNCRNKRREPGEKEKERESRDGARWANEEEDKRDIGEKESPVRERRDRVPGGQDRFELSKIYGRRFDLRARGVTPGSLGQGP